MAMTFTYASFGPYERITATWTSDGDGDAAGTSIAFFGDLIKGITVPDGTAAPTADYDITLTNEYGVDILALCADNLADRHTSNTEEVYFNLDDIGGGLAIGAYPIVHGPIIVTVAAAGATKAGVLHLFVFRRG
jgi:hypothetical protein